MCFTEFMGYTCGHGSYPVKRPCPMTTSLYNQGCCARSAVRPILEREMCPSCSRILHRRHLDLIHIEHRFMHERGVCGCIVQYPHLQRPRVVSRTIKDGAGVDVGTGTSKAGSKSQMSALATPFVPSSKGHGGNAGPTTPTGPGKNGKGKNKGKGKANYQAGGNKGKQHAGSFKNKQHRGRGRSSSSSNPTLAPLYEERTGPNGQNIDISLRTTSLYGAEWLQDHERLHCEGQCSCEIKFEKYPAPYMDMLREAYEQGTEYAAEYATTTDGPSTGAGFSQGASLSAYPTGWPTYTNIDPSTAAYVLDSTAPQEVVDNNVIPRYTESVTPSWFIPPSQQAAAPGTVARWACAPWDTANMTNPGTPYATAVPALDHPVDVQGMWYDQTETPLAGLPIGAGPEGDSHMPPFEECELYYPKPAPGHRRRASH
ncbi:hypothetical protein GGR54DRAFT_655186 [Hypoxylon sp. NC1633]|nr:hypothetical protein GGR54DRAFT_655186 [Hypoxylon sp. NC1633]